jgi:hypothetical protein
MTWKEQRKAQARRPPCWNARSRMKTIWKDSRIFLESHGHETGAWRGQVQQGNGNTASGRTPAHPACSHPRRISGRSSSRLLALHCFLLDFLGFLFFLGGLGRFLLCGFLAVLALAHDVRSWVKKIKNRFVASVLLHYRLAHCARVIAIPAWR